MKYRIVKDWYWCFNVQERISIWFLSRYSTHWWVIASFWTFRPKTFTTIKSAKEYIDKVISSDKIAKSKWDIVCYYP